MIPDARDGARWTFYALVFLMLAFSVTTVWAMTVTGIWEQPSLAVDHLNAGAGNDVLLLRFFLALGISGLAIFWAFLNGRVVARLARLAIIPTILLVFIWSVTSLDRFTPGFSEEEFLDILEAQRKGEFLTEAEVTSRLGKPLMTASQPDGSTVWSYTYTPSGGFGWPKRILTFNAEGALVGAWSFDEP